MKCYLLGHDLMFSTQVSAAAASAGLVLGTMGDTNSVEEGSLVVVDLTLPGLDIAGTISALSERQVRVIAVGPHVQEQRLNDAQQSGAYRVLTKGQAHRDLAEVLKTAIAAE